MAERIGNQARSHSNLAALGFIVQEFVHLPGQVFSNKVAVDAFFQVQIVYFQ